MSAMEDIRFYDFEFNLLHVESRYTSVNWQILYNDIGTFEAHYTVQSPILSLVMEHPYLVAVQGNKAAIITAYQLGEDLAVYGRTCNWLLGRRVVAAGEALHGTAEEIARHIVGTAFSDVETFVVEETPGFRADVTLERGDYSTAFDVVRDCLELDGGGHEVVFDPSGRRWVFRALKGTKRLLVLSEGNRNVSSVRYDADLLDDASGGWYRYQPEEEEGEVKPEAKWRYLTRDAARTGIYHWETLLDATTESQAELELSRRRAKSSIAAQTHGVKRGADYELGDLVKVQVQAGAYRAWEEKRITGVHVWYEENESGEEPVMEEEKDGISSKLYG